jgi:hypothetical protein
MTFIPEKCVNDHLLAGFDQVRIINLEDRPDRRGEMVRQLEALGGIAPNICFYDARRPDSAGEFPSIGARGCFESHLAILREAEKAGVDRLLIIEDDFDFTRGGLKRAPAIFASLFKQDWGFFYGVPLPALKGHGLVEIVSDLPLPTTPFVAFRGHMLTDLRAFLEAMLQRPGGSTDYGPMHVDGAYTVFRRFHRQYRTFAACPPLGMQRSSRSDITPSNMILDRWANTRGLAAMLRRGQNWLQGHFGS